MNTAADTEMDAEDYQPVELDTPSTLPPPPAALVAWQELADRDIEVMHDGDVSKMMPFPRPAWAEESYDLVGPSLLSTAYPVDGRSHSAQPDKGLAQDGFWEPAYVGVRAVLWGNGVHKIGIKKWAPGYAVADVMIDLTPDEAVDLAHAIVAAVGLIDQRCPMTASAGIPPDTSP